MDWYRGQDAHCVIVKIFGRKDSEVAVSADAVVVDFGLVVGCWQQILAQPLVPLRRP